MMTVPVLRKVRDEYVEAKLWANVFIFVDDLFQLVIRAGADPNAPVVKGLRPVHYAVHENNVEALELLLKYGVEVNQSDDNGYTPLHHAAKKVFKI